MKATLVRSGLGSGNGTTHVAIKMLKEGEKSFRNQLFPTLHCSCI